VRIPPLGLRSEDGAHVDRPYAAADFEDGQRVDLEIGELITGCKKNVAQCDNGSYHSIDIACRAPAKLLEQPLSAQLTEHRANVAGVHRQQPDGEIVEGFDEDAAEAE
jgi:hypothetical protein